MKCPLCKKEIKTVNVFSQCLQFGELRGKTIKEYGPVEAVLETQGIECPECFGDISWAVVET